MINSNILLTGVTGLIGRHVLFEFIDRFLSLSCSGNIYVLIRPRKAECAKMRLKALFRTDLLPNYLRKYTVDEMLNVVTVMDCSIENDNLKTILEEHIPLEHKLYVIHNAGSVNLRHTEAAEWDVKQNNYNGTIKLWDSLQKYDRKFIFISTVFSCGTAEGVLGQDYSEFYESHTFRNHYERYKNKMEKELIERCESADIDYQILRPSVTVGRLHDAPLYYVSKFDVIYGWTKFFWNVMHQKVYSNDVIRIQMDPYSKINIVPVDYVAKIIRRVFDQDIKLLNMVYPNSMLNRYVYGQMLEAIGFTRYQYVDKIPDSMNKLERLYYRSIHSIYSPYINDIEFEYETGYLQSLMYDIKPCDIPFSKLAQFAIKSQFDEELICGDSNAGMDL